MLQRHGLRIKYGNRDIDPDQIDWSRNDIRNFDLVQPPGPGNVLGRVKFVFPNKHDVYMHDTTQKSLRQHRARGEPWLHARAKPGAARRGHPGA